MSFLVDTNVLVYRYDPRFPVKQLRAESLLREGIASGEARIAHQAVVEFVAAVTRPIRAGPPLLEPPDARREAEVLLATLPVLYPDAAVLRLALRGAATYSLSWFDAHMWAYAEHFGIPTLMTEDLSHDGLFGTVRIVDPFRG